MDGLFVMTLIIGVLLGAAGIFVGKADKFGIGVAIFSLAIINLIIAAIIGGITYGSGGPGIAIICALFALACIVGLVICIYNGIIYGWSDELPQQKRQESIQKATDDQKLSYTKKQNANDNTVQILWMLYSNLREQDNDLMEVAVRTGWEYPEYLKSIQKIVKSMYDDFDEKIFMDIMKKDFLIDGRCVLTAKVKIKQTDIPQGVEKIGAHAFSNCQLRSIVIPSSVKHIGYEAFLNCKDLVSITFLGTKKQWNAISKVWLWDNYTGAYTIHCTDGDIEKRG